MPDVCGIAGLLRLDVSTRPITAGELVAMGDRMPWRGPDDEGFLLEVAGGGRHLFGGPVTPPDAYDAPIPYAPVRTRPAPDTGGDVRFAFRRLSLLDLSPGGHQPISDPTGRFWLLFNGEIYNCLELREELSTRGHRFHSGSDTEVILAAYAEWGADMLPRMNGMWGMGLWDARECTLLLARDRFGVKPLHYRIAGGRLAFASELKPIVLDGPRQPRDAAIFSLLARDWVDHEPETFFAGVFQLPAAHVLLARAGAPGAPGTVEVRRWWDLDPARREELGPREAAARFRELFDDAVRLRLRSDVPVGTCLSGGIDSTAILATAARLLPHPMRAFSVAYDEGPAYDERPWIDDAVHRTGATPALVVPDGRDFWETFDALVWHQEEPTAGMGLYSQWHVMKLAG